MTSLTHEEYMALPAASMLRHELWSDKDFRDGQGGSPWAGGNALIIADRFHLPGFVRWHGGFYENAGHWARDFVTEEGGLRPWWFSAMYTAAGDRLL